MGKTWILISWTLGFRISAAIAVLLVTRCHEAVHELRHSSSIISVEIGEAERKEGFGVGGWGTMGEPCFVCFVAVAEEGPGAGRMEEVAFNVFLYGEL
ncbi:hypothetical protein BDR03DRAFT_955233, partial [Suillus americanus]